MTINDRPSEIDLRYGGIIRRLRQERGWTIQKLAARAEYNPNHLGVLERGGNSMSIQSLLTFSEIFGLDPRDLLGEALGLPPLVPRAKPPSST
jgi:transcriptional regulator with XRE-family HTH domain